MIILNRGLIAAKNKRRIGAGMDRLLNPKADSVIFVSDRLQDHRAKVFRGLERIGCFGWCRRQNRLNRLGAIGIRPW